MGERHPYISLALGIVLAICLEVDRKPLASGLVLGQIIMWMGKKLPSSNKFE